LWSGEAERCDGVQAGEDGKGWTETDGVSDEAGGEAAEGHRSIGAGEHFEQNG
jgi:hypothetical protein